MLRARTSAVRTNAAFLTCLILGLALNTDAAIAAVIDVQNSEKLEFGSIAGDSDAAGTVIISAAGGKTVTGGVFDLGQGHLAAEFRVRGDPGTDYTCTHASQIQVISGGNTANVTNFTASADLSGTFDGSGETFIQFGATLELAAGQAAGDYRGTFSLSCGPFLTGTTDVRAIVEQPISIQNITDLGFGSLTSGAVAGTVTVTPGGARTGVNVGLLGGGGNAGRFTVTGRPSQTYAISLPTSITLTGPGSPMTVDTFTDDKPAPLLDGSGSDTINVGATLSVGSSQATGSYSGTFQITVNYQ